MGHLRQVVGIFCMALLVAPLVNAGFAGTDVYVASVGHGPGSGTSQWRTTVWIHNPAGSAANCQLQLLLRDQANPAPAVYNVSVPAGDTMRFDDAVFTLFGVTGYGALRVTSSLSVVVNSRIYNQPGSDPSVSQGQFFAAVPATFAIAAGGSTALLGVNQAGDGDFRYNYGFVETTGSSADIEVALYDETGALLGVKPYTLQGREAKQVGIADLGLGSAPTDNGRLQVRVTGGAGKVIAFGSGIANGSTDPSTFEMRFADSLLAGSSTGLTLPFAGEANTGAAAFQATNHGGGWAGLFVVDSASNSYPALVGSSSGSGIAVYGNGMSNAIGVKAISTNSYGIDGRSTNNIAVYARQGSGSGYSASGPVFATPAVWAESSNSYGIVASSNTSYGGGIAAFARGANGRAVSAYAEGNNGNAIFAVAGVGTTGTKAGYFQGDVQVTGTLSKGGGSFKIDHPLDPAGQYLSHSFVESPDMMNIYNGNAVLDADGQATVELPEWFEALNRDFRYQLTCVGGFAPVYIAEKIADGRFVIGGGTAGLEVSWQVTGIRKDPWAEAHRIRVEEPKIGDDLGRYLSPELYGEPEELRIGVGAAPDLLR